MRVPVVQQVRKSGMVRVRGGFSETNGMGLCNTVMQTDEFDDYTRIRLNNGLHELLDYTVKGYNDIIDYRYRDDRFMSNFCKQMLDDVFCEDNTQSTGWGYDWREFYNNYIKMVILDAKYNEVLDIIEYICQWLGQRVNSENKAGPFRWMNRVFEQEYIGYRFVDRRIVAITDKNELDAIEEACRIPFDGCRRHLEKAVGFLSDREARDYKNCIKESISAVESVCQIITGNSKATLGDALKNIETNGKKIHPSLSQAFGKLYGYTSDQGGIRHAEGLMESSVTFEEAKFMLVSCSAFTNYLVAEYGKNAVQQKE